MAPLILYYSPKTRSLRPHLMLEELQIPYELKLVDLSKGEHKQPEYLKLHPHGAVPVFKDGDLVIFESAAICAYLADKYGQGKIAPATDSLQRGKYYQWLFYAMSTMEPAMIQYFANTTFLPEEQRSAEQAAEGKSKLENCFKVLSDALGSDDYLVGNKFSTADVLIGSMLIWGTAMGTADHPQNVTDYIQRLQQRPAFARVFSAE